MLIQPFVENAIWHGLMNKAEPGGSVGIYFSEEEDYLICTISDDGVGRKNAQMTKSPLPMGHRSMGIEITKNRLLIMEDEKKEGKKAGIEIEDLFNKDGKPAGTKVVLRLPLLN